MSKFNLKHNVPDVYSYPFTRKELREIALNYPNIGKFSYAGISPHDQIKDEGKEIWLGNLIGKKQDEHWNFTLAIYANRKKYIEPILKQCQETILSETSKWLETQLKQPESFPEGSNTLYISVIKKNGQYLSNSSERKKTEWKTA